MGRPRIARPRVGGLRPPSQLRRRRAAAAHLARAPVWRAAADVAGDGAAQRPPHRPCQRWRGCAAGAGAAADPPAPAPAPSAARKVRFAPRVGDPGQNVRRRPRRRHHRCGGPHRARQPRLPGHHRLHRGRGRGPHPGRAAALGPPRCRVLPHHVAATAQRRALGRRDMEPPQRWRAVRRVAGHQRGHGCGGQGAPLRGDLLRHDLAQGGRVANRKPGLLRPADGSGQPPPDAGPPAAGAALGAPRRALGCGAVRRPRPFQGHQRHVRTRRRRCGAAHRRRATARHAARAGHTGRLGGDEFLVLLPATHAGRDDAALAARTVADKLADALRQPMTYKTQSMGLTPSIGIALYGDDSGPADATELLKAADLAMYSVKQAGRNGVAFFDPEMEAAIRARHALQRDLAHAIEAGELRVYLQPQVDARGRIVGAEALVRWLRANGTLVPPGEFIPLAEETGLILPLGDWVLSQALALLARWQRDPALAGRRLAVNVSPAQFRDPGFGARVQGLLAQHGVDPQLLELEITESVFLQDLDAARSTLRTLDALGVSMALDDFGTGYSSLAYLAELSFDVIKIDQRFVVRLQHPNSTDEAIVTTIIALGRKLRMQVLAEGVETERQETYLLSHGCHLLQGYRYGRPMPVEQFETQARTQPREPTA
ncbi:MAG: putative bifunctional diguanylate cyclase/phosphodiesterase [Tepidimonas sp.]